MGVYAYSCLGGRVMFNIVRRHERLGTDTWRVTVTPPSILGFSPSVIYLSDKQMTAYLSWLEGKGMIQDLLPELSSDEREILMTGIGPREWDEAFKGEE